MELLLQKSAQAGERVPPCSNVCAILDRKEETLLMNSRLIRLCTRFSGANPLSPIHPRVCKSLLL